MERARDSDRELAHAAAMAIAGIGRRHLDPVGEAVRRALREGDERPVWLLVLGVLGRDPDVETIQLFIHHRDPEVRGAAIEAAVTYGADFPEATLIYALADEHPAVRAAAARGLGGYRSPAVCEALLAAARDVEPSVAAAAVRSLGGFADARALATLMDAAGSSASLIAIAALQGLFRTNPPGVGRAVDRALAHVDPEVVREAVSTAMRLNEEDVVPVLVRCLAHRAWSVRRAAAEQIANRGLSVPRDVIHSRLLAETEPLVQDSLERLLKGGRLGSASD